MKRITLLSILFVFSIVSSAQNFKLGFQASPQVSWMNSSNTDILNSQARLGIKYGLDADIFIIPGLPRYCINTGLFVSNNSFKTHYSIGEPFKVGGKTFSDNFDIRFNLNYLEIPLDLKLRTDQFYRFTYYGQFGLSNFINISAKAVSSDKQLNGVDVNDAVGLYNLALLMGAGAEYDLGGNTVLNLGIQYSKGLIDYSTIKSLDESSRFSSLRLVLGVMF
jgi:hypothetical protein